MLQEQGCGWSDGSQQTGNFSKQSKYEGGKSQSILETEVGQAAVCRIGA